MPARKAPSEGEGWVRVLGPETIHARQGPGAATALQRQPTTASTYEQPS